MINQVNITNPKGDTLELVLADPLRNGILVKNIDGLAPSQATINYQSLATSDGGLYSSSRVEPRQIIFDLGMVGDNPEGARNLTYEYFPIKQEIEMTFISEQRVRAIKGYVEHHNADIFTSTENTSISVLCLDPWFYVYGPTAVVFSGVDPKFEFPFSNESLEEPLIEFGEVVRDNRAFLDYNGDIDTGVIVNINCLENAEDIYLFNEKTYERMHIDTGRIQTITGHAIQKDDIIEIDTTPGRKAIRLHREGEVYNIISSLDRNSDWLVLRNGTNVFGMEARAGENNLMANFTYRTLYGGF